ncbi:alpha/beta hydrolase, partial [Rhizobiaceae sp. 2RAB30]
MTRPNDPDASPLFADVRGLPPIMVQIGESEVMLSDAMRLAAHLAENRVRTSLEVWPE